MTDIPNQVKWFKVFQDTATDLKAEVALAAASEIIAKQSTAADLKALVTLAGLQGIIPNPITATRYDVEIHNVVNTTTVLASVVADTKLYATSIWLAFYNGSNQAQTAYMVVRDAADAEVVRILALKVPTLQSGHLARNFYPALEAVALYDIAIVSPASLCYVDGGLSGWYESV